MAQPMIKTVSVNNSSKLFKKVAINKTSYKYESGNGNVTVSFVAGQPAKDDVVASSTPVNAAMCLTKEEVKGQKVENELIIADGSKASQILPGAVIDADILLKSGEFVFMKMNKRKIFHSAHLLIWPK
ncbi:MAG: hypothetical protein IPG86_02670 [Chitinophagaceae bacterium]|nr:hypothetical protein [Chitinophagaceae bacterium]